MRPGLVIASLTAIWVALVALAFAPGLADLARATGGGDLGAIGDFLLCQGAALACSVLLLVYTLDRRHRIGAALRRLGYTPAIASGFMLLGLGAVTVSVVATAI